MELQKLRYFHTVAKFQHMTKAAASIKIAQPALTQAIRSLENELGVALFVKRGRNILLTEFGEHLMKRLDTLLPDIDNIPLEIAQMKKQVNKTVKLNILAASTFVINAIVNYRKDHPDAIFDFEQSALKYDCDIIISTNGLHEAPAGNPKRRCVKEENIFLAVPSDSKYASYPSIELAAVKDDGFVMLSNSRLFGVICNKFCSIAGFYPKILFESDSPGAVQNIISTGTGVAFWPEYSWGSLAVQNVVLLPITNPVCKRELIIELHERTLSSQYAEDFFDFLVDQINTPHSTGDGSVC